MNDFQKTFRALTDHPPFPWQEALFERFLQGDFPRTCSLPTGLGKTSLIALWLMALAERPHLVPRRLVYVVNRRTVVDQTTTEVEKLRENLPKCPGLEKALKSLCAMRKTAKDNAFSPLAISTLRGQFADNQEWSADPARPAVICGTVDMIGSRLLFSGYRSGFKSRPMQAGFLGRDALLIHDEAHLEPAFQRLLEDVVQEQHEGRFPEFNAARRLKVIELSATARGGQAAADDPPFKLTPKDFENATVIERMSALKQLTLHAIDDEKKELSQQLIELALAHRDSRRAILVFARSVETVLQVMAALGAKKLKAKALTGTMRGKEREALIDTDLFKRFLNNTEPKPETVYLVCTSAGEVGVNISADHLVCDLSTYDSMAQRFGRVNRFGRSPDTRIDVVYPTGLPTEVELADEESKEKPKVQLFVDARRRRTLELLERLAGQASPSALAKLDPAECAEAFAPTPSILPTSDILFDAWSLTTIKGALPGRPPVEDYLHGVAEWEPPRTQLAWREEVDRLDAELLMRLELTPDELLEDYPLKPHELLSDRSERVFDQFLKKLLTRMGDKTVPVWSIDETGVTSITTLQKIVEAGKDRFSARTLLLPPSAGGLQGGLLDATSPDANDVADDWSVEIKKTSVARRQRLWDDQEPDDTMRAIRQIDTRPDADDDAELDATELQDADGSADDAAAKRRWWKWYVRPESADDDGSKSAHEAVPWPGHTNDVIRNARQVADALLTDQPELHAALVLAARFHDFGKRRVVWQRSIGNMQPQTWYEKSGPEWRLLEVTRYRHEFGSLLDLLHPGEADQQEFAAILAEFAQLTIAQQDVVLHLIAVHHGRGRPHFFDQEVFDPQHPQLLADDLAQEIPRRFARLQRRFGRWGLAWLESLLRAADYAASSNPSTSSTTTEVTA